MAADVNPGARDWTSQLPASVLARILSPLTLRNALLCGFVSKPWLAALQDLLATLAELDFGEDFAGAMTPECYSRLVRWALAQVRRSENLRSVKFFLKIRSVHQLSHMRALLESASSERARLLELALIVNLEYRDWYIEHELSLAPWGFDGAPQCWRPLSKLSLRWDGPGLLILRLVDTPLELPCLQTLSLDRVMVYCDPSSVFDNCPMLSTLSLTECSGMEMINTSLLQRLVIIHRHTKKYSIAINAPELRSFLFHGDMDTIKLTDVRGLEDVCVKNMDRWLPEDGEEAFEDRITCTFLRDIAHISTLTLWVNPIGKYLGDYWIKNPPLALVFNNLQTLQLLHADLKLLIIFLRICSLPVLQNLFIELDANISRIYDGLIIEYLEDSGGGQYNEEQLSLAPVALSELRFVSLRGLVGLGDLLMLVEFFLKSAPALETFVCINGNDTAHKIEALQKVSKTLKILLCQNYEDLVGIPPPPHAEFRVQVKGS